MEQLIIETKELILFSLGGGGSNYGNHIDFVAPGDLIFGLYYKPNSNLNYVFSCGTSASAAIVSGIVSLMLSINPNLTFQNVYDLLKTNSKDQIGDVAEDKPGWDQYYGWGRVDAGKTLEYLSTHEIHNEIPSNYFLKQNYPNPFNISTIIELGLPIDDHVVVEIYDILGSKVTTLMNINKKAGVYTIYWDAFHASSGIYFCTFKTNGFRESKKLVLIK